LIYRRAEENKEASERKEHYVAQIIAPENSSSSSSTNFKQKPFVIVPTWCKSETREAHRNSRHAPESIPADVSRLISVSKLYIF
jgi:hypothetical protein